MQFFPNYGYGLHRLVYVSRSMMGPPDRDAGIADLVARSAANNRGRAVTGILLVCDGWFIQALEGSREALKPLYEIIAADPRHADVMLKGVEPASRRIFSRWGMKQGRTPPEGAGFDIAAASAEDLLSLLKLSSLSPVSRAA